MEMFKVSGFPGDVNSGAAPTLGAGRAARGPIPAISGGSQRIGTFIVDIRRKLGNFGPSCNQNDQQTPHGRARHVSAGTFFLEVSEKDEGKLCFTKISTATMTDLNARSDSITTAL
jgi:hypothetical protein